MTTYMFAYNRLRCDPKAFLEFPSFPEWAFPLPSEATSEQIGELAHSSLKKILSSYISARSEMPSVDPTKTSADGFIYLGVIESMKLELYKAFRERFDSVKEFADALGVSHTAAARLLDLHYNSKSGTIENAFDVMGLKIVGRFGLEAIAEDQPTSNVTF